MQAHTATLYAPARREQRFWRFENLLLRAMQSQTDRDLYFIVLTSTIMPQVYLDRLRDLVAGHPKLNLVISDLPPLNEGLLPTLAQIRGDAPGHHCQQVEDQGHKPHGAEHEHRSGFRARSGPRFPLSGRASPCHLGQRAVGGSARGLGCADRQATISRGTMKSSTAPMPKPTSAQKSISKSTTRVAPVG